MEDDADLATREFLISVLIPAWIATGLLDWTWHRMTKIEENAGAHESLTHFLMALESGVEITGGLFLEIDAGVIATMALCALLHEATVVWDVAYAVRRRNVPQHEDHTHSFLESLPFVIVAFAAFAAPAQALALVGLGPERPRFRFRPSRTPPGPRAFAAWGLGFIFGVAPYIEELVRCLRVKPTLAPQPVQD
ncbi:MAG TPA: hypothetical protein VHS78_13625 [Candidatus Elarobacter sp.]|jgi:hypothetical protein|nr:hypothetical protein [Candidatus Elarobacter sp.]